MKLLKKLNPFRTHFIALAAGGLMPFAFSPFPLAFLAFIPPAVLLYCLVDAPPKRAFNIGFAFGLGMFGIGVSWIYVSIHLYGNAPVPLAAFLTALFVAVLALFPATMCALFNTAFTKHSIERCIIAFPAFWVLFDMLRGWIFTGFPWLYIGNTQLDSHLAAFAPIGAIWATSWATVLTSSLLYYFCNYLMSGKKNAKLRNGLIFLFLLLWGSATFCSKLIWTFPVGEPISVALIQGNIPQTLRWDRDEIPNIISTYQNLTLENLEADIIVWPESAIPLPLPYSQTVFDELNPYLVDNNATLIAGIPVKANGRNGYYNGLMATGNGSGIYYKKQLVPFGDYVPFEKYLRGLISFFDLPMSSFYSVKTPQAPLQAQGLKVVPAICYEIAYPNLVQAGAMYTDLIVTVSNDTWFGRSIGPHQHLQIAQFRALETGRYVLRATNSGITAVIGPNGDIYKSIPQFKTGVLKSQISALTGTTPWVRYGPKPVVTFLLLLGFIGFIIHRRRT